MSQIQVYKTSGGGGGGVTTIDGDTGSATGSTITFNGLPQAGASVSFSASGSTVLLNTSDILGNLNTLIGSGAGNATVVADGGSNTGVGSNALASLGAVNFNTAIGIDAGAFNSGTGNIFVGANTGQNYTGSESYNVLVGSFNSGTVAESNTLHIGSATGTDPGELTAAFISGINGFTGSSGTMMVTIDSTDQLGVAALPSSGIATIDGDTGSATGSTVTFNANTNAGTSVKFSASGSTVDLLVSDPVLNNTFVGLNAGKSGTTSNQSAAFGSGCLSSITSGNYNTAIGQNVLNACQDGIGNVGLGTDCIFSNVSGDYNFGLGFFSLFNLNGGSSNVCIGHQSGLNYSSTESYNIIIGESVGGTVGEGGVTRIGTPGHQTAVYMPGISGVTVSGAAVLVSGSDQLGVAVSSRKYKDNINDMGSLSEDIYKLRPVSFNYNTGQDRSLQTGLIAEEVYEVMPSLVIYDKSGEPQTVKYHDLPALLLNELQKLAKRVSELESQLSK
jgi:hypothetical protein